MKTFRANLMDSNQKIKKTMHYLRFRETAHFVKGQFD